MKICASMMQKYFVESKRNGWEEFVERDLGTGLNTLM